VRDELSFTGMSPRLSCVPHGSPTSRCSIGLMVLRDPRGETMKRARWNERRANRMAENRKAKKTKIKRKRTARKTKPKKRSTRDVNILPTTDEVLEREGTYLPPTTVWMLRSLLRCTRLLSRPTLRGFALSPGAVGWVVPRRSGYQLTKTT
jgi:hypothetical protein